MRLGKNLRNAGFDDPIAQFRLENEPFIVADKVSFDLVAGPFQEPLDVVGAKAVQAPDNSFLQQIVGTIPLKVPIRVMRDTILPVRKGCSEKRIHSGLRFGLEPPPAAAAR